MLSSSASCKPAWRKNKRCMQRRDVVFDDLPGDDPYVVSSPYFKILFFSFLRPRY